MTSWAPNPPVTGDTDLRKGASFFTLILKVGTNPTLSFDLMQTSVNLHDQDVTGRCFKFWVKKPGMHCREAANVYVD